MTAREHEPGCRLSHLDRIVASCGCGMPKLESWPVYSRDWNRLSDERVMAIHARAEKAVEQWRAMGMPMRAAKRLGYAEVTTIQQVKTLTDHQLLMIEGISKKTLASIRDFCSQANAAAQQVNITRGQRLDTPIQFRVSEVLMARMVAHAEAEGMSVSDFCRYVIRAYLDGVKP